MKNKIRNMQSKISSPAIYLTPHWLFAVESAVVQIECLVAGNGIPHSNAPFSHLPPDVLCEYCQRFSSCTENIPPELKARFRDCERQIQDIVQECWNEGQEMSLAILELSFELSKDLSADYLKELGYQEAEKRYPFDLQRAFWFLSGWLACLSSPLPDYYAC